MFWKKKKTIESEEYLKLKTQIEDLKIELRSLKLEFELIVKKLKVKYKITTRDKDPEETEDLLKSILLKEDGTTPNDLKRR